MFYYLNVVVSLKLVFFDPYNETIAINMDYAPLWIAKISITPAMKRDNPEIVEKLLLYQLKIKDILAVTFLPNQETNNFQQQTEELKSVMLNKFNKLEKLIKYKDIDYQSKYSDWKKSIFNKINILTEYHNTTRNQQFAITYRMFEGSIGIYVNDIKRIFCKEHNYKDCYPLDAIEANEEYKTRFDSILQVRINKMNKEIKLKEETKNRITSF